jgi:hypothetical protein
MIGKIFAIQFLKFTGIQMYCNLKDSKKSNLATLELRDWVFK